MNTRHLVKRLSVLPGPGTPREYLELLGPTIHAILEEAGDKAHALVERQLATAAFRPTPAELRGTWLSMVSEAGQARDASIAQASRRCPYCQGVGQVTAWVASRRQGKERVRTYSVTCGCPRGMQLHGAQLQYGHRLSRGELESLAHQQRAPSEFHDGVLALYVDDCTKGARPDWTRWAPAMEPPKTRGNIGAPSWARGRS